MTAYSLFAPIYDADQCWLEEYNARLLSQLDIGPHDVVIEIGCGTGILGTQLVDRTFHYIGFDLELEMLRRFQGKLDPHQRARTTLAQCDATNAWPFRVRANWIFLSINTLREIVPASAQSQLLLSIGGKYLKKEGTLVMIFSNYFRWLPDDVLNLRYHTEVVDATGTTWLIESRYLKNNKREDEFVSEFKCVSRDGQGLGFSCPITWKPLEFYLLTLSDMGFRYEIYGDFDKARYSLDRSDFAIIEASRSKHVHFAETD